MRRDLRAYTEGFWPGMPEYIVRQLIGMGGSVWRYKPPSSPEWPEGYWGYAAGGPDLESLDILEWIGSKYIGDWAPENATWTIERLDRVDNPRRRDERAAARRFIAGLSRAQLFELGDQLVWGTFDWREWMNRRPSPAFLRALDGERIYAEEESAYSANPGSRGVGGKVDWPGPRMTPVSNKRGKVKKPKLHVVGKKTKGFYVPSPEAIADLGVGDFAKVAAKVERRGKTGAERFWVRVTQRKGKKMQGVVDNELVMTSLHGLSLGDTIAFGPQNLYDAVEQESMNRAHANELVANPHGGAPPKRRSDKLRVLEKKWRRYKLAVDDIDYTLDVTSPTPDEKEVLEQDKKELATRIGSLEDEMDVIEREIELHGDIISGAPAPQLWRASTRRNPEDEPWIQEKGSLGTGFLTTMSFAEQKSALERAMARELVEQDRDYKAAYRSTLGKVMVLNRSGALRREYGTEIDRIRDWFVAQYGAGSKRWPDGRAANAIRRGR